MDGPKFRIAILVGADNESTRLSIESVAALPQVRIAGILVDTETHSLRRRLLNLRRNIRREGLSYPLFRLGEALADFVDFLAGRLVSRSQVEEVLRACVPERTSSLEEVSEHHNIPIERVGNLNRKRAEGSLRALNVDLAIVLGTRILKRSTFAVPRFGSINLHKGRVPEYRGTPPGFWSLYEGQAQSGVTVHHIDDGLDTGDVVGSEFFPIHPRDTPQTLRKKLNIRGAALLARCVRELAEGIATRTPQADRNTKARTAPTRRQRRELESRLPALAGRQSRLAYTVKALWYLLFYCSGLFWLLRAWRRLRGGSRGTIILYHRVNDLAEDELTINVERFIEHLLVLKRYYRVVSTADLVEAARTGKPPKANYVAIHFDDCYRDVCTTAARILAHFGFPSCFFVSSGFVGTNRVFAHDFEKCPFLLENLNADELSGLAEHGVEVAAHTVNHVDLGRCSLEEASFEVNQSKADLERIVRRPVTLFSFPYGGKKNIRPEVAEQIRQAGFQALFSGYGGHLNGRTELFDIPRIGVSGNFRPLDLLMEIEGLSFGSWRRRFKGTTSS